MSSLLLLACVPPAFSGLLQRILQQMNSSDLLKGVNLPDQLRQEHIDDLETLGNKEGYLMFKLCVKLQQLCLLVKVVHSQHIRACQVIGSRFNDVAAQSNIHKPERNVQKHFDYQTRTLMLHVILDAVD